MSVAGSQRDLISVSSLQGCEHVVLQCLYLQSVSVSELPGQTNNNNNNNAEKMFTVTNSRERRLLGGLFVSLLGLTLDEMIIFGALLPLFYLDIALLFGAPFYQCCHFQ